MSNWEAVLNDLSDEYYCLAPDVLGFGDSTHPDPPLQGLASFNALRVRTLIDLIDELGLPRVTPVGNSMGALADETLIRPLRTIVGSEELLSRIWHEYSIVQTATVSGGVQSHAGYLNSSVA
jgi:hypothetical protein